MLGGRERSAEMKEITKKEAMEGREEKGRGDMDIHKNAGEGTSR